MPKSRILLRVEAGIDAVKIAQRANEKSRADEDDNGERDLRDDEGVAETEPAAACAAAPGREEAVSLSEGVRSTREPRSAGARPKRIPVAKVMAMVKASTRQSGARTKGKAGRSRWKASS